MGAFGVSLVAFFAAMTNALQSRVNGEASALIGNPIVAAMMSVGGGFVAATTIVLVSPRLRNTVRNILRGKQKLTLQPWHFFAGIGGGVFIFGQALVVPLFGVSIFIIAVVAGQTFSSLFVDKFGLGPAGRKPITTRRVFSAALATMGVVVSSLGKAEISNLILSGLAFGIFAGAVTAVQYALNGKIAVELKSPILTSSLNFFMGFCFLSFLLLISTLFSGWPPVSPPNIFEHPHLWAGGLLGLTFIASAAFFVGRLGVLRFSVVSVLGQLGGAFLLDVFVPAPGTSITVYLPIGLVISTVAVFIGSGTTSYRTVKAK